MKRRILRGTFWWRRGYVGTDGKRVAGDWVEYGKHRALTRGNGLQVIRDVDPYRSMRTGEMIGGRRQHREHLRQHGLVEVGNEMPKVDQPDRRAEQHERVADIKRAMGE